MRPLSPPAQQFDQFVRKAITPLNWTSHYDNKISSHDKKKTLSYVQVITHYERGKMVQGFVDKFILD